MTADGPWVCGNCRSLNRAADARCYSCRSPRAMALDPHATEAPRTRLDETTPAPVKAAAARSLGSKDRTSAPLALVAQAVVLAVTAITLTRTVLIVSFLKGLEGSIADPATFDSSAALDSLATLGILSWVMLAGWVIGLIAWGAWLARVVANVPALGGGWTSETPRFAFVSTLIPGGNLYWTTSTMRQAIVALSPAGSARLGLITAWWLALAPATILLLDVGPFRVVRTLVEWAISILLLLATGGDLRSLLDASIVVELVTGVLVVLAATLAVLLIQRLEGLQADRRTALGALASA